MKRSSLSAGHLLICVFLPLFLLLAACTAEPRFSTQYPCSFVFYASSHLNSALTLAVGNAGQFCIVEPQLKNGVTHLILTPNTGTWTKDQTDVPLVTAIENDRLSYDRMGANKRLIIGASKFNGLRAFDGQCPNCLANGSTTNRPLSWADKGQLLECQKCGVKYNPNAEGIPLNGQDDTPRLIEYRAEYNGDRLYVHN